jgi:hypothetical protein
MYFCDDVNFSPFLSKSHIILDIFHIFFLPDCESVLGGMIRPLPETLTGALDWSESIRSRFAGESGRGI